jgi:hypothetical protein
MASTAFDTPHEVRLAELLRSDWMRLVWGFVWRGACVAVLSGVGGATVGFVVGFFAGGIAAMMGIPPEQYALPLQVGSVLVALAAAVWLLSFYVRWLLRARFGSLRLALVHASAR